MVPVVSYGSCRRAPLSQGFRPPSDSLLPAVPLIGFLIAWQFAPPKNRGWLRVQVGSTRNKRGRAVCPECPTASVACHGVSAGEGRADETRGLKGCPARGSALDALGLCLASLGNEPEWSPDLGNGRANLPAVRVPDHPARGPLPPLRCPPPPRGAGMRASPPDRPRPTHPRGPGRAGWAGRGGGVGPQPARGPLGARRAPAPHAAVSLDLRPAGGSPSPPPGEHRVDPGASWRGGCRRDALAVLVGGGISRCASARSARPERVPRSRGGRPGVSPGHGGAASGLTTSYPSIFRRPPRPGGDNTQRCPAKGLPASPKKTSGMRHAAPLDMGWARTSSMWGGACEPTP